MKSIMKPVILSLLTAALGFFLFSCRSQAVVALINTDHIQVGEIYRPQKELYKREGTQSVSFYQIYDKKTHRSFQEKTAFFQWCKNKKELKSFCLAFQPFHSLYAKSKTPHFIRSEKSPHAPNPYRMKAHEEVKVISIDPKTVEIDGKQGHWVEVLSKDGYRGFSFDYKLELVDKVREALDLKNRGSNHRLLSLLANRFYPDYYQEMIDENRIDLSEINETNGFYYSPESKLLVLKTATLYRTFNPSTLKATSENDFTDETTGLIVNILAPNHLFLSFPDKGETKRFDLYQLDRIPEIARAESETRLAHLNQILEMGGTFVSSSYGSLTVAPNSSFIWTGYDRLVPSLIPNQAGNSGSLSFHLFLSKKLEQKYTDALYFNFKNGNKTTSVPFFLSIMPAEKAIRLISVPKNLINANHLIENDTPSPVILHFQAGKTP